MSQRESGYQRKLFDQYETPAWVTLALIPHLSEFIGKIWEPACGSGKMVAALRQAGFDVVGSDITQGADFLGQTPETGVSAIITNPPYALARKFIERALHFDDIRIVAMLLRTDFDHAASRAHLFADCAMFAKKVVLTKRIRWFEDSLDQFKQRLRIACLQLVTAGLLGQGRLKTQDPTGFAQLDCNKAAHRVIIASGGRSVLHADFHWSLLCG